MVNLFQRIPERPGSLTAALLALLEHSSSELANALLRKAGAPFQVPADGTLQTGHPAPGGPQYQGLISAPGFSLRVLAQAPGEPLDIDGLAEAEGPSLAITPAGKAAPGTYGLSWEQVDRVLADIGEKHSSETRTGFLVRQFRDFLPQAGVLFFRGFPPEELEAAPGAHATLSRFFQTVGQFFDRLVPTLADRFALLREARPEDLLAGYGYRDFGGERLGPDGFLRVAFHLPRQQLQLSVWPGGGGERISEALRNERLLAMLRDLEDEPLLWLWSAEEEQRIPLADLTPSRLDQVRWPAFQAGIQRSISFEHLADEGLVGQVAVMTDELLDATATILIPVIH